MAYIASNGARLLVRGLVKRPGKARPNRLSNSTPEFHQTTYQKPYPITYLVGSSHLIVTIGLVEDHIVNHRCIDIVKVAGPINVVAHPHLDQVQAVDPVEVAHGDGREGHRGRRDVRVGGDGRSGKEILDYDDETSQGDRGSHHQNCKPVKSSTSATNILNIMKQLSGIFLCTLYSNSLLPRDSIPEWTCSSRTGKLSRDIAKASFIMADKSNQTALLQKSI